MVVCFTIMKINSIHLQDLVEEYDKRGVCDNRLD